MIPIIRPIEPKDFNALVKLAFQSKPGITNLPKNEKRLKQNLEKSLKSFAKKREELEKDFYLFVIEDSVTKSVGGISAIFSLTGGENPLCYYKLLEEKVEKNFSEMPEVLKILKVNSYQTGPSEICSLFLDPCFRSEGLGRLLSLARFHFIASFRKRFSHQIFAEMRGVIDEKDECPFWNGLGRFFLDIDFATLMNWRDQNIPILPQILPKYPIYTSLLSKEARHAIGRVHPNTEPALHMLLKQGFQMTKEIDLFDGGPRIMAECDQIQEIRNSRIVKISKIQELNAASLKPVIVSNLSLDFRASLAAVEEDGDHVFIDRQTAESLMVEVGDQIRFSARHL